ncbi:DEAD-domain-containing protein [Auriculariales sp. MPI-PUGE-AT-0066]|nr:DEAD-domain-containing protein [Auriculariales sp. MPI-PUGE-AT-0066]
MCRRQAESQLDVPELELEGTSDQVIDNFDDMGLKPELLRGIYASVPVSNGRDLDPFIKGTQTLILVATRELAQQFKKLIITLSDQINIECHACVGGVNLRVDIAKLQEGPQIVVGTPGRVFDMINRRALSTDKIKLFCLDEADELLSRGFGEQIDEIYKLLPQQIQLAKKITRDPVRIAVKRAEPEISLEGIKQFYIAVEKEEWKLDTLFDLYETVTITQATVFCNSRRQVEWLAEKLRAREFSVSVRHDDMEQKDLENALKEYRCGSTRVLITTDLLARNPALGTDVCQVSLFINFDFPTQREIYVRRSGRGGRFGRKAVVINFATNEDLPMLREVERYYHTEIPEMPLNVAYVIRYCPF